MTYTIRKTKTLAVAMLNMLIIFAACKKDEPVINAASVTISAADDFILAIGQDSTLTASVLPETTTNKTITWTVEPAEGVVTLSETAEGVTVTAAEGVSYGASATITATAASGKSASIEVTVIFEEGYEVVEGEWQIYTEEGLKAFAKAVNGATDTEDYNSTNAQLGLNAILMDNINLTAPTTEGGSNWTPIGWYDATNIVDYGYYGTFDGNGKTISGLKINSTKDYIGLFGKLYNNIEDKAGTIKNMTLTDPIVSGSYYVGVIAGNAKGATIENCNVEGDNASVSGTSTVGGIVGDGYAATITACNNTARVSGEDSYVGGIVGDGEIATITACYNAASVSGKTFYVGGIVGAGYKVTITACYNTASVSGASGYVGGVVGSGYKATIRACYNIAGVSGAIRVGGVVGDGMDANINTIYWIDVDGDDATAAYTIDPTLTVGSMDATDLATLNSDVTITALNAAIPATVTNAQDVVIDVNYKFVKDDSTPKLVSKE